MTLQSIT